MRVSTGAACPGPHTRPLKSAPCFRYCASSSTYPAGSNPLDTSACTAFSGTIANCACGLTDASNPCPPAARPSPSDAGGQYYNSTHCAMCNPGYLVDSTLTTCVQIPADLSTCVIYDGYTVSFCPPAQVSSPDAWSSAA